MVDLKRMLERETEEFYDRQDFPINDGISNYEIEEFNGFLHIKKYSGFDEDTIEIPAVINGKKVITIGENAFCGCLHLKHLIVPEGVQTIMNGAFCDCTHLFRDCWGVIGFFRFCLLGNCHSKSGIRCYGYGLLLVLFLVASYFSFGLYSFERNAVI